MHPDGGDGDVDGNPVTDEIEEAGELGGGELAGPPLSRGAGSACYEQQDDEVAAAEPARGRASDQGPVRDSTLDEMRRRRRDPSTTSVGAP